MILSSGQKVEDMVTQFRDTTLALKTGRSVCEHRRYEAMYIPGHQLTGVCLPLGIDLLLRSVPLSQDTVSILTNACELGLSEPCVTLTHSQKLFLARHRQNPRRHRNFLDSVPILLEPDNPDILFEKMFVLALSLFAWYGFNNVRCQQSGRYATLSMQLADRLVQHQPETDVERRCKAWMWLMAIDVWRIGTGGGILLPQGLVLYLGSFISAFRNIDHGLNCNS